MNLWKNKFIKGVLFLLIFGIVSAGCFVGISYMLNMEEEKEFDLRNSIVTKDSYEQDAGKNDKPVDEAFDKEVGNNTLAAGDVYISDVIEFVMPSIVSITSKSTIINEDFFFGRDERETVSIGSGIIISYNNQEVLIATNNHVVEDSEEIAITFYDDSIVYGNVKGADSHSDLAVVSVNKADMDKSTLEGIRVASLSDSDKLRVGESVVAVGNAMGYGNSVTVGILSAKNREIDISDGSMKLLQTDAAINPGNSGGALINLKGEVIGINSVKYVSAYAERMGYAIPINTAIPILNELINYEEVNEEDRGYLGIIGRDVTDLFAIQYKAPYGVYVYEISEDSPALDAGMYTGDIIVEFNGRTVENMEEISNMLKYRRAGDVCKIKLYRFEQGKYKEYDVEVELSKKK